MRTYRLLSDGRRQINSFHLPGDMFGFESDKSHRFSAEALVETKVRIVRQRALLCSMADQAGGTTKLIRLVTQNLQHAESHMLLLGPTSRRDIGDYLGLTLETVSREISILRDAGSCTSLGRHNGSSRC
ncbi:helix-turn-helix domain-containing protein [Bradyrhizobium sp. 192]|uniref:helix-turn-helix domain-containing protein n=1 Tax=Bradyrhizobium sp. 192 TaxID=2782660 RepID=UPI003211E352